MGKVIDRAVDIALKIANDDSHGYSQTNRWGNPDYDCSSFVITCWQDAGVPVKTNGATYTGNMLNAFLKSGFKIVDSDKLQKGDVLLNVLHHTAMYIGNNKIVYKEDFDLFSLLLDSQDYLSKNQSYSV